MGLPPALAFGVLVVVVAAVGFALGLALAPRMIAWDERRARRDAADGREPDDAAATATSPTTAAADGHEPDDEPAGAADRTPPSDGGDDGD